MGVKTAISLDDELFQKIEAISKELQISRSRLFALAVQEFIAHHENLQLLHSINLAYDDEKVDSGGKTLQKSMRSKQRNLVEGQW
ncbi:MAG: ribbon-helix-helix domain-containing protein [Desulfobacteraceae bacterium]|nr:MAG: ribbon-helix-helix domain-containing protein [Desulfobacteraceae bacterium]